MDDLSRLRRLNADRPDHGVRGGTDLSVCGHYGKATPIRFPRGQRFSKRGGTPLFRSHLSPEKANAILEHVAEGCGVRQTERLVGVRRGTVARYSRKAGDHAKAAHDELVAISPLARVVQFDEKWSYVAKKEKNYDRSDPADNQKGDRGDHVAFDPEHRLVVAVVPGARDIENTEALMAEFRRRIEGRTMEPMTSDSHPAYETTILQTYGETVTPPRTGKPGRPPTSFVVPRAGLTYATVEKRRGKGRVVEVLTRVILGAMATVQAALARARIGRTINTSFVERHNGTDRHHNARKARKTYRFSKDWRFHEAVTCFTMYGYNFCRSARTLREPTEAGRRRRRTPAMVAGLSNHVRTRAERIRFPVVLRTWDTTGEIRGAQRAGFPRLHHFDSASLARDQRQGSPFTSPRPRIASGAIAERGRLRRAGASGSRSGPA